MRNWPKQRFRISGRTSRWTVSVKYLPGSFTWRAYVGDGDRYVDKAPDSGYLAFVVK